LRLVIIGGSDAGIAASLRARQVQPETDVTVLLEGEFPNFSVCGLPFYVDDQHARDSYPPD
jgi:NADPH-dependent 2,4-dienoyl-CoA reductase/sulfur reductase-like enzyme